MGERSNPEASNSWVAGLVKVMWQLTCGRRGKRAGSVRRENGTGQASPGCSASTLKSMLARASRGGVPVLRRPVLMPRRRKRLRQAGGRLLPVAPAGAAVQAGKQDAIEKGARGHHQRPASDLLPGAGHHRRHPAAAGHHVHHHLLDDGNGVSRPPPAPAPRRRTRRGRTGSATTRSPAPWSGSAAGTGCRWHPPARPSPPPRASISCTRWPLAVPPMAGLQDRRPMAAASLVTRPTLQPRRAAVTAASMPACPPPMTIRSNIDSAARPGRYQSGQRAATLLSSHPPSRAYARLWLYT